MINNYFSQPFNGKSSIWILGIPYLLFGAFDRSISAFSDNYVSFPEFFQILTIALLLILWICLKPEDECATYFSEPSRWHSVSSNNSSAIQNDDYLPVVQARMLELRQHHMISQSYILPFPYLSQVYHLLNLKHLESVHNFSLSNLKVVGISDCQPTRMGGQIKFKTAVKSPMSVLKVWRQPVVEVELTLHTPYTVELNIPIHGDKRMIVIFNSFPVSGNTHELLIDIYTDLGWSKPLLQILLHVASALTLYEDLPYLKKISEKNLACLLKRSHSSSQESMWLFKRFVDLYASKLDGVHEGSMPEGLAKA